MFRAGTRFVPGKMSNPAWCRLGNTYGASSWVVKLTGLIRYARNLNRSPGRNVTFVAHDV